MGMNKKSILYEIFTHLILPDEFQCRGGVKIIIIIIRIEVMRERIRLICS